MTTSEVSTCFYRDFINGPANSAAHTGYPPRADIPDRQPDLQEEPMRKRIVFADDGNRGVPRGDQQNPRSILSRTCWCKPPVGCPLDLAFRRNDWSPGTDDVASK